MSSHGIGVLLVTRGRVCSSTFNKVERHLEAVGVVVAIVEHVRADAHAGWAKAGARHRVQREQHRLQRLHATLRHHRPARGALRTAVHLCARTHLSTHHTTSALTPSIHSLIGVLMFYKLSTNRIL